MPQDIEVTLVRRKVTNASILESAASCKNRLIRTILDEFGDVVKISLNTLLWSLLELVWIDYERHKTLVASNLLVEGFEILVHNRLELLASDMLLLAERKIRHHKTIEFTIVLKD